MTENLSPQAHGSGSNCFSFLFWNTARKRLAPTIARLASEYSASLLMIAECSIDPSELCRHLAVESGLPYYPARLNLSKKISVFVRNSQDFWKDEHDGGRFVIGTYSPPLFKPVRFVACHLPSQNNGMYDVEESCRYMADSVRDLEARTGNDRTVVIGDFNLGPFSEAMIASDGLHATMCAARAQRPRKVRDREVEFFYNPMWNLLGDKTSGPPGTYYHRTSQKDAYFWNTYDQVILRPSLLGEFDCNDVRIVTEVRGDSLLTRLGLPNRAIYSDHLPLAFSLRLTLSDGANRT